MPSTAGHLEAGRSQVAFRTTGARRRHGRGRTTRSSRNSAAYRPSTEQFRAAGLQIFCRLPQYGSIGVVRGTQERDGVIQVGTGCAETGKDRPAGGLPLTSNGSSFTGSGCLLALDDLLFTALRIGETLLLRLALDADVLLQSSRVREPQPLHQATDSRPATLVLLPSHERVQLLLAERDLDLVVRRVLGGGTEDGIDRATVPSVADRNPRIRQGAGHQVVLLPRRPRAKAESTHAKARLFVAADGRCGWSGSAGSGRSAG